MPEAEHIHVRAGEAINRLLWRIDDGLVFVEARIQDRPDARALRNASIKS